MSDEKKDLNLEKQIFSEQIEKILKELPFKVQPLIINKNDSMKKRIELGLSQVETEGYVLLVGKSSAVQKAISITEIIKQRKTLKQYNKLSKISIVKHSDIESSKTINLPILLSLLAVDEVNCQWTKQ
ncbi:uncharacterized protein PRCAT00002122001 [Priceomyces carsonii]|uniref:uncharacterized protein n=1 Tax=Priceomyces carsonii TaxID=28549 RepID=UPI002EDA7786|nr:unnamed protein product [Priceomyces carsonii]